MIKKIIFTLLFISCACTLPLEVEQVKPPSTATYNGIRVKCKLGRELCISEITKNCGEKYYLISDKSYSAKLDNDKEPGIVPWYEMLVGCGNPPDGFKPAEMAMPSVIKESLKEIESNN